MGQYQSVLSMMQGNQSGTASVPTQSFAAQNILGTVVPQVGNNTARPDYSQGVRGLGNKQVVLTALFLIALGYLLYHLNFEA